MKTPQLLIMSGVVMAAASCSSITPETNTTVNAKQGVPGGEVIRTSKITATVTGIDAAKRNVTLVTPEGKKFTVKAGPEVVNFGQIRTGDQLKATLTEKVVIRMAKPGEKAGDEAYTIVNLAPVGAKPSVKMSDTAQITATVSAIDHKKHKATLRFSDGTTESFDVRPDVDLTKRKVGEKVVIRATEVYAVRLEKP